MSRSSATSTTVDSGRHYGNTSSITHKSYHPPNKHHHDPHPHASDDDDDSFLDLTLIGTPIDTDEQRYQQQRAAHRPLPPAPIPAFTPAAFLSSRSHRAARPASRVRDYMDREDEAEDLKGGLAVSGDIEAGQASAPSLTAASVADQIRAVIMPRQESVAVRLLRQMGWREGRGVGPRLPPRAKQENKQAKAGIGASGVSGGNSHRKRVYSVALPPSLQALKEEEEAEGEEAVGEGEEGEDGEDDGEDDSAELSAALSSLTVPDVPVYVPTPKNDTFGLGYDPLAHAEEFQQYQQGKQQQQQAQANRANQRPQRPPPRPSIVLDDEDDEIIEVWDGKKKGNSSISSKPSGGGGHASVQRQRSLPGFMVGYDDDEEYADDEIEVYGDRQDYDAEIGKVKTNEPKPTKRMREQAEKQRQEQIGSMQAALSFIPAALPLPPDPLYPPVTVPPGYDGKHVFADDDLDSSGQRMEEGDGSKKGSEHSPQQLLRDYALRMRQQLRMEQEAKQRQDEEEHRQQQRAAQRYDQERAPPASSAASASSAAAATSSSLTSSSLGAASFFSRFEEASSSSPQPALEAPRSDSSSFVDAPRLVAIQSQLFDSGSSYAIAAQMGLFGARTREILPWKPDRLVCRRLGVPEPKNATTTTASKHDHPQQPPLPPHQMKTEREALIKQDLERQQKQLEEDVALHPSTVLDVRARPPVSLFKAIFEDNDYTDLKVSDATISLLSSILQPVQPSPAASASVATSSVAASSLTPASFVHPSRQHQVPRTTPTSAASAPVSAAGSGRRSRWGGPVQAAASSGLASSLPPSAAAAVTGVVTDVGGGGSSVVGGGSAVKEAVVSGSLLSAAELSFAAVSSSPSSSSSSLVFSSSLLSSEQKLQLLQQLESKIPVKVEKNKDSSSRKKKKKKKKKKHSGEKKHKHRERGGGRHSHREDDTGDGKEGDQGSISRKHSHHHRSEARHSNRRSSAAADNPASPNSSGSDSSSVSSSPLVLSMVDLTDDP